VSDSEIKVKVGFDGATQAAAQVDKLTTSLERQRKTQQMISATTAQIQKQNVVDALKKEAEAVNGVTAALQKNQQAARQAAQAVESVGVNSQALRQRLSPAAALVGNLSNQFSVLMPGASGATKALQVFGMAGSQMLGVLGGGPGVLIGGLVAGIGALATYMASAKTEADERVKSTEANAKAMGTYLDRIDALRSKVSAAYDQKKNNQDIRSRILSGEEQNPDSIAKELETQRARLKDPYYTGAEKEARALSLRTGDPSMGDALLDTRKGEARAILNDIAEIKKRLKDAQGNLELIKQQKSNKLDVEGDIVAAGGLPESPKDTSEKDTADFAKSMALRESRQEQYEDMVKASEDRIAEYTRQQHQNTVNDAMLKVKDQVTANNAAIDEGLKIELDARAAKDTQIKQSQDKLAKEHSVYQDLAIQGSQIVAGSAIKSFQAMAKGQKAQIGMVLEGVGDQAVAMGTMTIFDGLAKSIMFDARGPALLGIGAAEVAFGIGLGAAGSRAPGGSSAGGAPASANPLGANPYSNPTSPVNQDKGPTIININMPTVVSPSPEDGRRIQEALDAKMRVYG